MHFLPGRSIFFVYLSFAGIILGAAVQKPRSNTVDTTTLQGKFLYGYQGFFRRPGQGNDHWTIKGLIPGPSTPGDGKELLSLMHSALYI